MDEIKAQKKALKKAYKKAKRKTVLGWKILTIICAILMVVFIPLCTILNTFDNTVAAFVGGTFWKLENEDTQRTVLYHRLFLAGRDGRLRFDRRPAGRG